MRIRPVFFLVLLALSYTLSRADPEYKSMGPDIFDRQIKGEELVAGAIKSAEQQHKRILLLFGANWCPWCRRLHSILTENQTVKTALKQGFILVYIDANTRNDKKRNAAVIERYGNPLENGLPAFVVLDEHGNQLATQETASLAAPTDDEVAKRLIAFMRKWFSCSC